ncbi:hypothetical protein DL769_003846 [Monosporascus sp. CRB-8-3]|nr:hypothetical protein DL769_003846 [Monosporascus sp. CRB-8-3]
MAAPAIEEGRYDNAFALNQIEDGHYSILSRPPTTDTEKPGPSKKGETLPRVITLGGDHTITLPLLRSKNRAYGPVSAIHFDSHLDTPNPKATQGLRRLALGGGQHQPRDVLLPRDARGPARQRQQRAGGHPHDAQRAERLEYDGYCGFEIVEAREIDGDGAAGIIKRIVDRIGTTNPAYLSLDIDALDPAFAPATGTPETGGWSTREPRAIPRGLEDVNLIAADIVEVAPAYDTNAE